MIDDYPSEPFSHHHQPRFNLPVMYLSVHSFLILSLRMIESPRSAIFDFHSISHFSIFGMHRPFLSSFRLCSLAIHLSLQFIYIIFDSHLHKTSPLSEWCQYLCPIFQYMQLDPLKTSIILSLSPLILLFALASHILFSPGTLCLTLYTPW